MRKDKETAFELRKQGNSYNDISKQLYIPKSTLSKWFADVEWSRGIKKRLTDKMLLSSKKRVADLSRDRGERLKSLYLKAENEARAEYEILRNNPLFISVLMLYWAEGDKSNKNRCSLSNYDPSMLRLFSLFLEKICGVEKVKIKAWILGYRNIDQVKALEFWSKTTKIWPTNFLKTVVLNKNTGRYPMGRCYVVVSSTYLKKKITIWVKLLNNDLLKNAGIV